MMMLPSTLCSTAKASFPTLAAGRTLSTSPTLGNYFASSSHATGSCSSHNSKDHRAQNGRILRCDEKLRRRLILLISFTSGLFPTLSASGKTKSKSPYDERRLLEQNKRRQRENNAPEDFPNFIREGFEVKVITTDDYIKCDSGLIYRDFEVGKGDCPKAGQQVTFHYIGYNESGRRIDSTYLQGAPARIRMGTNALVPGEETITLNCCNALFMCYVMKYLLCHDHYCPSPIFPLKEHKIIGEEINKSGACAGFEEGIRDMRAGGKRRIIIPPELGPPVGPSTFFSSKQFEVFDVELVSIQDCQRRTIGFYSDFVCT
ncbi:Peptidyl-prolyl cis-trans isomerase, FKBP-type [Trema orientale]|uniref:peptidylprolyl isomerase n=1 Tax=Trema orientale TaxID=63057 RepID=A0A2P5DAA9_TREOI|nr:Peptidyl-prolyl cis-trans isomerase, FKBP-type [Trema orientale]